LVGASSHWPIRCQDRLQHDRQHDGGDHRLPSRTTNTAKSTLAEAIKGTCGDYAAVADFETFLRRRGDGGIRNDIARLAGARVVISVEVDEGKALAEGLLKLLTGGDTVAARFLYSETFEFVPRFTLWLAANERPRVRAEDAAMWRRIVQLPLTQVIPDEERDERVKIELRTSPEARSAILAWAVQGCLEWQRQGLAVPECVRTYTDEYRREQDRLGDWIETCCTLEPVLVTTARDLRKSYDEWCEANAERPVSNVEWGRTLRDRGCSSTTVGRAKAWTGIGLEDAF
jgi:putative DNA primase/helicase